VLSRTCARNVLSPSTCTIASALHLHRKCLGLAATGEDEVDALVVGERRHHVEPQIAREDAGGGD
jgi:hypothetical protein